MSASARSARLTLRRPAPAVLVPEKPRPVLVEKPAPVAEKPKGPAQVPRAWRPATTVPALRQQLAELLADGVAVPPVLNDDPIRPLAIHTDRELLKLARDGHKTRLRLWLHRWCTRWCYHVAVAGPGAWRHALDGTRVEPVSADQRAHAAARLAERLCRTRR